MCVYLLFEGSTLFTSSLKVTLRFVVTGLVMFLVSGRVGFMHASGILSASIIMVSGAFETGGFLLAGLMYWASFIGLLVVGL